MWKETIVLHEFNAYHVIICFIYVSELPAAWSLLLSDRVDAMFTVYSAPYLGP